MQPDRDQAVEENGDPGHADHQPALDVRRRLQAVDGLPEDIEGDQHQGGGVSQGGEDADPVVAEGRRASGGLLAARTAYQERPSARASARLWPASEISARLLDQNPATPRRLRRHPESGQTQMPRYRPLTAP